MNLISTLRAMRPTLLLMSGRAVGLVVAFGVPMALVRVLDHGEFGTYRLLFLMFGTLASLAQMGLAESLYYFVPRRPSEAGRWLANAVAALAGIGIVVALIVALSAPLVGARFRNPMLVAELPKLGLFLGLMLASTAFEIGMVCRKRYRQAAIVYGGSDVFRALMLVVPAALAHSLDALMNGAIAFAAIRCVLAVVYLKREFGQGLRLDRRLWSEQLRYALPFAGAVGVELTQQNLHQYAIALWFDPVTFGIYSVGCLQIPIVDLIASSAANVMMVSMSDQIASGGAPLRLWNETVQRLAFVFVPMVVVLLLVAPELITFVYTSAYLASVPVFRVSAAFVLLSMLPVDAVLRVYAQTRTLLALSVLRLALIVSTIAWFVGAFSLPGAVLVTLVAALVAKVAAVVQIRRLMGASVAQTLPWRGLAGVAAAALLAAGPAWLLKIHVNASPLPLGLATGAVYGVCYLAIVSVGSWLRASETPAVEPSGAM